MQRIYNPLPLLFAFLRCSVANEACTHVDYFTDGNGKLNGFYNCQCVSPHDSEGCLVTGDCVTTSKCPQHHGEIKPDRQVFDPSATEYTIRVWLPYKSTITGGMQKYDFLSDFITSSFNDETISIGWDYNFEFTMVKSAPSDAQSILLRSNDKHLTANVISVMHHPWQDVIAEECAKGTVTVPMIGASSLASAKYLPPNFPLPQNLVHVTMSIESVYQDAMRFATGSGVKSLLVLLADVGGEMCSQMVKVCDYLDRHFDKWSFIEEHHFLKNSENLKASYDPSQYDKLTGGTYDALWGIHCLESDKTAAIIKENEIDFKAIIWTNGMPQNQTNAHFHISANSFQLEGDPEDIGIEYSDYEFNLFEPEEDSNDTAPQVFAETLEQEWRNKGFDIKMTNEYDQWAGMFYIHRAIETARQGGHSDLTKVMREVGYFLSPFGIIGNDKSGSNRGVMKPITCQFLPSNSSQSELVTMKTYAPPARANTFELVLMPNFEDRECAPNCPECYDNVCEFYTFVIFVSMPIIIGLCILISTVLWLSSETWTMYSLVSLTSDWGYHVFAIICALLAILSMFSVRKSADEISSVEKYVILTTIGGDGILAAFSLINKFIVIGCGSHILPESVNEMIDIVAVALCTVNAIFLILILSSSNNQTSTSMPLILDVLSGCGEVVLWLLKDTVNSLIRQIEEQINQPKE